MGYEKNYSEESFWDKIAGVAKKSGGKVIYKGLLLYYALQRDATPAWAKTVIISALGYFIFPIDAIPDPTPMVGFADDLGVLTAALATCASYINNEVKTNAKAKITDWFGNDAAKEIAEVDNTLS